MNDPSSPSAFAEAASAWLDSPAALAHAAALLRRKRLGINEADVVADVRSAIWMRVQRPHDHLDPASAEAYCKRVAHNVVNDVLRGYSTDPLDDSVLRRLEARGAVPTTTSRGSDDEDGVDDDDDRDDDHGDDEIAAGPRVAGAAEHELIEQLRSLIETSGEAHWVVSGALTYLTLEYDRDCDRSDAPWPQAGSAFDRALLWPALWFAGKRDGIFPTDGRNNPAQRQRLKRAGEPIYRLIALAKSTLANGGPA